MYNINTAQIKKTTTPPNTITISNISFSFSLHTQAQKSVLIAWYPLPPFPIIQFLRKLRNLDIRTSTAHQPPLLVCFLPFYLSYNIPNTPTTIISPDITITVSPIILFLLTFRPPSYYCFLFSRSLSERMSPSKLRRSRKSLHRFPFRRQDTSVFLYCNLPFSFFPPLCYYI